MGSQIASCERIAAPGCGADKETFMSTHRVHEFSSAGAAPADDIEASIESAVLSHYLGLDTLDDRGDQSRPRFVSRADSRSGDFGQAR